MTNEDLTAIVNELFPNELSGKTLPFYSRRFDHKTRDNAFLDLFFNFIKELAELSKSFDKKTMINLFKIVEKKFQVSGVRFINGETGQPLTQKEIHKKISRNVRDARRRLKKSDNSTEKKTPNGALYYGRFTRPASPQEKASDIQVFTTKEFPEGAVEVYSVEDAHFDENSKTYTKLQNIISETISNGCTEENLEQFAKDIYHNKLPDDLSFVIYDEEENHILISDLRSIDLINKMLCIEFHKKPTADQTNGDRCVTLSD